MEANCVPDACLVYTMLGCTHISAWVYLNSSGHRRDSRQDEQLIGMCRCLEGNGKEVFRDCFLEILAARVVITHMACAPISEPNFLSFLFCFVFRLVDFLQFPLLHTLSSTITHAFQICF